MQVQELSYQLPSSPSTSLSVRIHRPPPTSSPPHRFAVFSHPYGRLGGSMDDAVVQAATRYLASEDWTVILYNSRGVGGSGGSASWSGIPEANDYQAIVDGVLAPMLKEAPGSVDILLAGYSYGSLAASVARAPSTPPSVVARTRHLLLSYPLSVLSLLTFFRPAPFRTGLSALVADPNVNVLYLYGMGDQFTGPEKYQAWVKSVREQGIGTSNVVIREVQRADHFWTGERRELCTIIEEWLDGKSATSTTAT